MAQKQGSEYFAPTALVQKGETLNRHVNRVEIYTRDGIIHVLEGENLPDYILLETDFRRVHGNVMKIVEKKKKESLPWTTADYALVLCSMHFACWIISRM